MRSAPDLLAQIAPILHSTLLPYAILFGLVLACVALSFAALLRAAMLSRSAAERAAVDRDEWQTALDSLRREMNTLTGQIRETTPLAAAIASPAMPRPGWNLSNRSQALRMHRRGAEAAEIASTLAIPLQEVDLLLKVHRIVIRNL
jgi:hypothetical protein